MTAIRKRVRNEAAAAAGDWLGEGRERSLGAVNRIAARMDDRFELVAGALSFQSRTKPRGGAGRCTSRRAVTEVSMEMATAAARAGPE